MRVGLIADIHGNLVALETVLQELAREPVDQIVCLGDVFALGPQPCQVIDCLRQLNCPVILGNTDDWLLSPLDLVLATSPNRQIFADIVRWCADQFAEADMAYLRTFAPTLEVQLADDKTMLCFHGSPRSFDDVIAATTLDAGVAEMLAGASAAVMVGGHTHIQLVRRFADSFLVNAGSVGLPGVNPGDPALPMNHHVRWAEYGIVRAEQRKLSIELRRTPLDITLLMQEAQRSGMPHLDWWLQKWDAN